MLKRILKWLGVLILLLGIAVGVLAFTTFGGLRSIVDGADLVGGARVVKDGYVAVYVLPAGAGQVALIDCGNDASGAAVLAELKRRNLGPEAVKGIFLTHGHPDHIAACHLFTAATIYGFGADAALAAGRGRSRGPLPRMLDTPKEKRIEIGKTLSDGEVVTVGDLKVTAWAVPGHTAGSAVFTAGGVAYGGDSLSVKSDGTLRPAPWAFSDSTEENHASLRALAKRIPADVTLLAPSHSGSGDISALKNF